MLTQKTNSQWNQFLSLFIKMNFSRYACSHCSYFLSDDQVRKQSAKSKRSQKTTSNENDPTAKAKPCLVLRDREQKSEEISSQSLGSRVNLVYADERKEVVRATKQLVLLDSNSEIGHPQASWQENSPQTSKHLVLENQNQAENDEKKYSDSKSSRKLAASSPELKKNGIHEPWLHEQDISVFAEEIGNVCNQRNILNGRIQHKCIDMENVYHFVDESRHSSWAEFQVQIGHPTEHKIRRARSVLANDQANKWVKAKVCVYADSVFLCWTDETHSRSHKKMGKWNGRNQVTFVLPRCSGYRWRSNWIRVENFPKIFIIVYSWKNRRRLGDEENPSRRKSSQTGSSSCQRSMTLYGMQMMRVVFQIPQKPIIMQMLSWTLDIIGSMLRRKVIWKY